MCVCFHILYIKVCLFHRTKCISKQGYWKKCAIRPFCWRHLAHTWRSFYSFWDLDVGLWLYLWPYPKFIWRGLLILCVRSRLNFYWINLSVVLGVQVKTFTRSLSPLQMHTAVRHNAIWDDEEQHCHQLKPDEKKKWNFSNIIFESATNIFKCFITFRQNSMNTFIWMKECLFFCCILCCCLIVLLCELTIKFVTQSIRRLRSGRSHIIDTAIMIQLN